MGPGVLPYPTGTCIGRLAQLVESACLTSRRSLVRIQQRPLELPGPRVPVAVRAIDGLGLVRGDCLSNHELWNRVDTPVYRVHFVC